MHDRRIKEAGTTTPGCSHIPEYLPGWTVMPVSSCCSNHFSEAQPWLKDANFRRVAAYVVEPVFICWGFYVPSGWEHHYSCLLFPIYMAGYWFLPVGFRHERNGSLPRCYILYIRKQIRNVQ
jgi:hypothetical protein